MSETILGKLIEETAQQRDAIHIAVASVVATETLKPGEHIGLVGDDQDMVSLGADPIGIVDPFLVRPVRPGERFWIVLYPNTITSLRHVWVHPVFGAMTSGSTTGGSKEWIEAFAAEMDLGYRTLMDGARRWVDCEDYTNMGENESYKGVDYAKWEIFWTHYEIVTGTKVKDHGATFFTCSC